MTVRLLPLLLPFLTWALEPPASWGASKVCTGEGFTLMYEDEAREKIMAMGMNNYGQLGIGEIHKARNVSKVLLNEDLAQLACGRHFGLFLTVDGKVYGTGRNNWGQMKEDDTRKFWRSPELIVSGGVKAIAAGAAHSLFLLNNGSVQVSGWNSNGQLGVSEASRLVKFDAVAVAKVVAGYDWSFFLLSNGSLYGAGQNSGGQFGDGTTLSTSLPKKIMDSVKDVAAGESHSLILLTNGSLLGTGANYDQQLGVDNAGESYLGKPVLIASMKGVQIQEITAGAQNSAVFEYTADRKIWTMYVAGSNRGGQLGMGDQDTVSWSTPIQDAGVELESYAVSSTHCAIGERTVVDGEAARVVMSAGTNLGQFGEPLHGDGGPSKFTELKRVWDMSTVIVTMAPTSAPEPTDAPTPATPAPVEPTPSPPQDTPAPPTRAPKAEECEKTIIPSLCDWQAFIIIGGAGLIVLSFLMCCLCRKKEPEIDETELEQRLGPVLSADA